MNTTTTNGTPKKKGGTGGVGGTGGTGGGEFRKGVKSGKEVWVNGALGLEGEVRVLRKKGMMLMDWIRSGRAAITSGAAAAVAATTNAIQRKGEDDKDKDKEKRRITGTSEAGGGEERTIQHDGHKQEQQHTRAADENGKSTTSTQPHQQQLEQKQQQQQQQQQQRQQASAARAENGSGGAPENGATTTGKGAGKDETQDGAKVSTAGADGPSAVGANGDATTKEDSERQRSGAEAEKLDADAMRRKIAEEDALVHRARAIAKLRRDAVAVRAAMKIRNESNKSGSGGGGGAQRHNKQQQQQKHVTTPNLQASSGEAWPEPRRRKCHWDYVLEEMAWLAEDVMQERAWKQSVAGHLARSAKSARTWLALPLEERQLKQTAAKLGAFVGGFWQSVATEGAEQQQQQQQQQAKGGDNAKTPKRGSIDAYALRFIESVCAAHDTGDVTTEDNGGDDTEIGGRGPGGGGPWLFLETSSGSAAREAEEAVFFYDFNPDSLTAYLESCVAEEEASLENHKLALREWEDEQERLRRTVAAAAADAAAAERRLKKKGLLAEADANGKKGKRGKLKKKGMLVLGADEIYDEETGTIIKKKRGRDDAKDKDLLKGKKKGKKGKLGEGANTLLDPTGLLSGGMPPGFGLSDIDADALLKGKKGKAGDRKKKGDAVGKGRARGLADKAKGRKGLGASMAERVPWTKADEQMLLAIVHEFGSNWQLVADVVNSGYAIKGVYRRPEQCKMRFRVLQGNSQREIQAQAAAAAAAAVAAASGDPQQQQPQLASQASTGSALLQQISQQQLPPQLQLQAGGSGIVTNAVNVPLQPGQALEGMDPAQLANQQQHAAIMTKQNARQLLQRGQPADDELVKRHLDQIQTVMKRFQMAKTVRIVGAPPDPSADEGGGSAAIEESGEVLLRKQAPAHGSHAEAVRLISAGGFKSPRELAISALQSLEAAAAPSRHRDDGQNRARQQQQQRHQSQPQQHPSQSLQPAGTSQHQTPSKMPEQPLSHVSKPEQSQQPSKI